LAVPLDGTDLGRFATPDGRHRVCGEHGALYRPDDGLCVAGPCLGARLRALPVVVPRRQGVSRHGGASGHPRRVGPTLTFRSEATINPASEGS